MKKENGVSLCSPVRFFQISNGLEFKCTEPRQNGPFENWT
jgi:hypothetical protein